MYLLDTDTCIHFTRGGSTILQRFRAIRIQDVRISMPTVFELEVGVRKSTVRVLEKRRALSEFLELFFNVPFGREEACEAAQIRAELEKAGTPIGSIDYLIAGVARAHNWTLVTGNLSEFRRVKNLRTEKWHE